MSLKQARLDRTYLYVLLVVFIKKNDERKLILKYEASQDEIMAWIELFRDYDIVELKEFRRNKLKSLINVKYHSRYPEGNLST